MTSLSYCDSTSDRALDDIAKLGVAAKDREIVTCVGCSGEQVALGVLRPVHTLCGFRAELLGQPNCLLESEVIFHSPLAYAHQAVGAAPRFLESAVHV